MDIAMEILNIEIDSKSSDSGRVLQNLVKDRITSNEENVLTPAILCAVVTQAADAFVEDIHKLNDNAKERQAKADAVLFRRCQFLYGEVFGIYAFLILRLSLCPRNTTCYRNSSRS
jgi:hypothetical protein